MQSFPNNNRLRRLGGEKGEEEAARWEERGGPAVYSWDRQGEGPKDDWEEERNEVFAGSGDGNSNGENQRTREREEENGAKDTERDPNPRNSEQDDSFGITSLSSTLMSSYDHLSSLPSSLSSSTTTDFDNTTASQTQTTTTAPPHSSSEAIPEPHQSPDRRRSSSDITARPIFSPPLPAPLVKEEGEGEGNGNDNSPQVIPESRILSSLSESESTTFNLGQSSLLVIPRIDVLAESGSSFPHPHDDNGHEDHHEVEEEDISTPPSMTTSCSLSPPGTMMTLTSTTRSRGSSEVESDDDDGRAGAGGEREGGSEPGIETEEGLGLLKEQKDLPLEGTINGNGKGKQRAQISDSSSFFQLVTSEESNNNGYNTVDGGGAGSPSKEKTPKVADVGSLRNKPSELSSIDDDGERSQQQQKQTVESSTAAARARGAAIAMTSKMGARKNIGDASAAAAPDGVAGGRRKKLKVWVGGRVDVPPSDPSCPFIFSPIPVSPQQQPHLPTNPSSLSQIPSPTRQQPQPLHPSLFQLLFPHFQPLQSILRPDCPSGSETLKSVIKRWIDAGGGSSSAMEIQQDGGNYDHRTREDGDNGNGTKAGIATAEMDIPDLVIWGFEIPAPSPLPSFLSPLSHLLPLLPLLVLPSSEIHKRTDRAREAVEGVMGWAGVRGCGMGILNMKSKGKGKEKGKFKDGVAVQDGGGESTGGGAVGVIENGGDVVGVVERMLGMAISSNSSNSNKEGKDRQTAVKERERQRRIDLAVEKVRGEVVKRFLEWREVDLAARGLLDLGWGGGRKNDGAFLHDDPSRALDFSKRVALRREEINLLSTSNIPQLYSTASFQRLEGAPIIDEINGAGPSISMRAPSIAGITTPAEKGRSDNEMEKLRQTVEKWRRGGMGLVLEPPLAPPDDNWSSQEQGGSSAREEDAVDGSGMDDEAVGEGGGQLTLDDLDSEEIITTRTGTGTNNELDSLSAPDPAIATTEFIFPAPAFIPKTRSRLSFSPMRPPTSKPMSSLEEEIPVSTRRMSLLCRRKGVVSRREDENDLSEELSSSHQQEPQVPDPTLALDVRTLKAYSKLQSTPLHLPSVLRLGVFAMTTSFRRFRRRLFSPFSKSAGSGEDQKKRKGKVVGPEINVAFKSDSWSSGRTRTTTAGIGAILDMLEPNQKRPIPDAGVPPLAIPDSGKPSLSQQHHLFPSQDAQAKDEREPSSGSSGPSHHPRLHYRYLAGTVVACAACLMFGFFVGGGSLEDFAQPSTLATGGELFSKFKEMVNAVGGI